MALSCHSPPPLFILNLPGFNSFAQADQISSSCLQLLPKVAEDQPGLGQHSTVLVSPSHVCGVCLRTH